jgi:SAM-dependent methyltransferase
LEAVSESAANANVWKRLYAEGKSDLRYPNDVFVRLAYRYIDSSVQTVLDYGCGTGANLIHLAQRGFNLAGVEISEHALETTRGRLAQLGLNADLRCVSPGEVLPWASESFDAVIAWQVLCYNDWQSWSFAVGELDRLLRPGGVFICATTAPGDISQKMAESLGDGLYRSNVPGQEGCLILIPSEDQLERCFPGKKIEVGELGYSFGGTVARHWIVVSRKN